MRGGGGCVKKASHLDDEPYVRQSDFGVCSASYGTDDYPRRAAPRPCAKSDYMLNQAYIEIASGITVAFTYSSKCIAELTQHRHWCKLKPPNEMEHENEE
jgi:hypothetical protein